MLKRLNRKAVIITAVVLAVLIAAGSVIWLLSGNGEKPLPPASSVVPISSAQSKSLPENPIDFAKLSEQNPDICGWLTVPNTNINYPVLQSSEKDDTDFYLTHDVNRKYTIYGSIYIQRANSKRFDDNNTVIYGHNMRDGSMFRHLHKFRDAEFFSQNEFFYIYTQGHIKTYRIFAAYRYDNRNLLGSFDFNDRQEYRQYLDFAQNPDSPIKNVRQIEKLTAYDKIVTLSTCISDDRYRYLVQGVLVSDELTR